MGDGEDNTGDPRIPRHARAQTERSPKEKEREKKSQLMGIWANVISPVVLTFIGALLPLREGLPCGRDGRGR
jgi:hypothetical protein